MYKKGFTLIELLVVIAIIGILASIVLVSLNSARSKGRDASRVTSLHEMAKTVALFDADPAPTFWVAVNGTTACGAYADVNACLGIGKSGASVADGFGSYDDPSVTTPVCRGTAGTATNALCQYSIAKSNGAASPSTQDFEICSYLESGSGSIPSGMVRAHASSSAGILAGCL